MDRTHLLANYADFRYKLDYIIDKANHHSELDNARLKAIVYLGWILADRKFIRHFTSYYSEVDEIFVRVRTDMLTHIYGLKNL